MTELKISKIIILLMILATFVVFDHFSTLIEPVSNSLALNAPSKLTLLAESNQHLNPLELRAYAHQGSNGNSLWAMGLLCLPMVLAGSMLYYTGRNRKSNPKSLL